MKYTFFILIFILICSTLSPSDQNSNDQEYINSIKKSLNEVENGKVTSEMKNNSFGKAVILYRVINLGFLLLLLLGVILGIIAIIDIMKNDFKKDVDKILWYITVIIIPIIGSILYFAMSKKHKRTI